MKFPEYGLYEPGIVPPINGYIGVVGSTEYNSTFASDNLNSKNLRIASLRLGQGCMVLASKRNHKDARKHFKLAKASIKETLAASSAEFSVENHRAVLLETVAHMLDLRKQPITIDKAREKLHADTISGIVTMKDKLTTNLPAGTHSKFRGYTNELTTLALFTRYKHPWMTALPALEHHDQSKIRKSNYDLMLVESGPTLTNPLAHKVQVKSECLGFCCGKNHPIKSHYAENIIMVSGHCDLLTNGYDSQGAFPVRDLLINEFYDVSSDQEIRTLDQITNNLLFSITSDERRRGSQPLYD